MVGPASLAFATVQMRYDANADGRIDSTELQSPFTITSMTSGSSATTRGQFRLDALPSEGFNPAVGVLQITSTGGTSNVLFNEIPATGPVEHLAYLTRPISESNSAFQVVLSPLTTLGSNLFRNELQAGKPTGFNLGRAYAENLGFVADALGVSMPIDALMSTSPERSSVQRLVAERQVNVLLNTLVSLASGKSDASAPATSANTSADIGYRLANYLVSHGGLGMLDAAELHNVIVSVLPNSAPIAEALSVTLEKLMRAFTLSNAGDDAIAQATMKVLPQLSGTLATMNNAMLNGTLDDATLQSNFNSSLSRISVDLESTLRTATPSAYTRVLMTSDGKQVIGAFIDRNMDGQLNADDKLNSSFVTADFAAGKNADPIANRVVITYLNRPGAIPVQLPSTLTSNDRVSIHLDSANFVDTTKVQNLDLEWSALDSSVDARTLKTLDSSGLKPNLSLTARGYGSIARLSMGKLGNASESVTASLGIVSIIAAGNASADGKVKSTAEFIAELKGVISGPARVQAAGMQSVASMTIVAPAGLQTEDLFAVSTGRGGVSTVSINQTAADKTLKVGSLAATSHSADGASKIVLNGSDGNISLGSQLSALAAGGGSNASIEINGGKGSVAHATAGSYANIMAIATGARFFNGSVTNGSNASVTITSLSNQLDLGSVRIEAGGTGSTSQVTATSPQGALRLYGSASVVASAPEATASLTLSGNTGARTEALSIAASGDRSTASTSLSSTKGIGQIGGVMNLSASGANSLARLDVTVGGSKLQFDGIGTVASDGFQSTANVTLNQQVNSVADITFAKNIALNASGAGSTVGLALTQSSGAAGNLNVAGISLTNSAKSVAGTAASQFTFVTAKGNFSANGPLVFAATGENSTVTYRIGTKAALDVNTQGDVSLAGAVEQRALGANSNVQGFISAARKISADSDISITASGSNSTSSLTFDGKAALSLGRFSSSSNLNSSYSVEVASTAYGAKAAAYAKQVEGDITLNRTLNIFQAAQYADFNPGSNLSQIDLSGTKINRFTLSGDLNVSTSPAAVNASAVMNLSAGGNTSIRQVDNTLSPLNAFFGEVGVQSYGFNSLAKLKFDVNTSDVSGTVAGFSVDGAFSVISARAGQLTNLEYGARSQVSIAGKNATLRIGGDLNIEAKEDLANARADFSFNPTGASTYASAIDGNVKVSASGVASEALLRLTGATPVDIKGNLSVKSIDPYAEARIEAANVSSVSGDVSVIAGQFGSAEGSYALASIRGLGSIGPKQWLVTAFSPEDIAVLDVAAATYGGSIAIGKDDQINETGIVYLRFSKAMASNVSVNFEGVSTIGIAVPDGDLNNEVLKSSVLTISGFRLGIDKLHFDTSTLLREFSSFDLRNVQVSDDLKINLLIEQAKVGLQGRPQDVAGFAVADIGTDKYIAYDLNGSGVTGLIKLAGLAGADVFNKLQTVQGVPTPSLQMPTQNSVTTVGSIIKSSGDIVASSVIMSTVSPFLTNQVTYKASAGRIDTGIIELSTSAYRSAITFDMSAQPSLSGSPIISTGSINLNNNALESQINFFIASLGNSLANSIKIAGAVRLNVLADNSRSDFNVQLNTSENLTVTDTLIFQAAGYKSIAAANFLGIGSTISINNESSTDVSLQALGFLSEARLRVNAAGFSVTKNISVKAVGAKSYSDVNLRVLDLGATIGGDVLVEGLGESSNARFQISPFNDSREIRTFSIKGNLAVKASGGNSTAEARIDVQNVTFKASVAIGAELSSEARGQQSFSSAEIAVLDGGISANQVSAKAFGFKSAANLLLVSGGKLLSTTNGQPGKATDSGNIAIDGAVSVRSDATERPTPTDTINANAHLIAYKGDVRVGSIDVLASAGVAHLRMQGGFNSNLGEDVSAGSVIVSGATVLESLGASSKAEVSLFSNQQTLSLNGTVRVVASGSGSSSIFNADATAVEKPGVLLPQALISLQGNLEVVASGNSASASAVLSETGRDLSLSGNINLIAAGDGALAESTISATGLNSFVSTLALSGGLALNASGVGSKAKFSAYNNNVITNATSTPPRVGLLMVDGPISVLAAGDNSTAEARIENSSANASAAGMRVGELVTLKAIGDGSTSKLTLSSTAWINQNESIRALFVPNGIEMQAVGADATASAILTSNNGDLSLGGVQMSASGSGSRLTFSSDGARSFNSGSIEAIASGDKTQIDLDAEANEVKATNIHLIGSGDNSLVDVSLKSFGSLAVSNDVKLSPLGDGSEVRLTLSQSAGTSVSVNGDISLVADSGEGSTIGAKATGDLTLGKLGTLPIDLFLNAVQDKDSASLSLKLFADGGVAKLGGADQLGVAKLTLGEKSASANQLLDEIDISFTGLNGKSIIEFGADQDIKTEAEIQRVLIKGFRLGQDELNFDGLAKVASTAKTFDGFLLSTMSHFNTASASGTTSAQTKVADVFVGGNDSATYLAYDYDGTGISAIITLDGVSASQYKTANGMS